MNIIALIVANLFPIVCVICATILLLRDNKEGWGWLVFIAATTAVSGPTLLKLIQAA